MKISKQTVKIWNAKAEKGSAPMIMTVDGQWFSWIEGNADEKTVFGMPKHGREEEIPFKNIDMIKETIGPADIFSVNEATTLSFDQADKLVSDTLKKYKPGRKRTFLLQQIITAMMKKLGGKQAIMKANNLVLRYDLDQNDNIPLYKVSLK